MRSIIRVAAFAFASLLPLLATSCAANTWTSPPAVGVTSMQGPEPTEAREARPAESPVATELDPRTNQVSQALASGNYAAVLALTEVPSTAPRGAWLDYDRASALVGLGRTDEAVEAFKTAEARFAKAGDPEGQAVAIWGRARALAEAGRCAEARVAFADYKAAVRLMDPRAAEMAAVYSDACSGKFILR